MQRVELFRQPQALPDEVPARLREARTAARKAAVGLFASGAVVGLPPDELWDMARSLGKQCAKAMERQRRLYVGEYDLLRRAWMRAFVEQVLSEYASHARLFSMW
jgi:hypothetical protein